MASRRLEPPALFPFSHPDEWPQWKRLFEQFKLVLGLSAERMSNRLVSFCAVLEIKQRIYLLPLISLRMTETSIQELLPTSIHFQSK